MIAERRAVVLALCAVLALKSAASAAGFGEAGCPEGTRRAFDEYTGRYVCVPNEPVIRPLGEKPNAALATLRAGAWLERGGFGSFEPARSASASPVAASGGEYRVVAVGWDTPNLTPPNLTPPDLTPPNRWTPNPTPVPVEVRPIDIVRPVEPIRAVPIDELTPCGDLTNKARRLRNAAAQCDADMAAGRSSCSVVPQFQVPIIPRSLSANGARSYAGQFESVAVDGSEQSCAEFGGEGSFSIAPPAPAQEYQSTGARKRCMDSYLRENYNNFVADILVPYFSVGSMASIEFWKSCFHSAVVKGSLLAALGAGRIYYSTREYEALGKALTDWGWMGVVARRSVIAGASVRAAHLATAQAFVKYTMGIIAAGGGSFATAAHAMALHACWSEAP